MKKPACKSDKNRRSQRATNESNDESNHYAVSGAVNSKFQLVYDVIQLDRGKESQLTSSASAINSNVIVTSASAAPCDKHPPEYFAQLLLEKQQQKSKLNQLWPKHWGCKIIFETLPSLSIESGFHCSRSYRER